MQQSCAAACTTTQSPTEQASAKAIGQSIESPAKAVRAFLSCLAVACLLLLFSEEPTAPWTGWRNKIPCTQKRKCVCDATLIIAHLLGLQAIQPSIHTQPTLTLTSWRSVLSACYRASTPMRQVVVSVHT
ncbi:hypothetical protein LX32DRAFT_307613 [Colletotrichum zoysiae]|uniref:Uncharacterized protein n=1 Tax=Colletotrichum zoysiae TaxID=1216348 RepID=A0AAD9M7I7_9PEZI|nr:hypothetical protein LX32DRAFT_307613 [Colletotrichum zoysiae]